MKNMTPVGELNRALSSTYRHAAGGVLEWKQEKAFFEAQIKRNPKISRAVNNRIPATIESLKLAVRECAAMGLSMSPNAQLVYFIPRKTRKMKPGESKSEYDRVPIIVTATPSYRGLAYSAMNYAGAEQVAAEVVFEADKFEYRGPVQEPLHIPTLNNKLRNEGSAIGVYAVVRMQGGTSRCEYVDAPTVQKIRQLSDFPNGLMWTKLWTEGWRKVPIRRICKTVMVTSSRLSVAIESLNRVEGIGFDETPVALSDDRDATVGVAGLADAMNHRAIEHEDLSDESEPKDAITLQDAAESTQPPGTIEWWCDQIMAAESLQRLDDIKVAALSDGVDQSEDADAFRQQYSLRFNAIKEGEPE